MEMLHLADLSERFCNIWESFFFSYLSKPGVKCTPFQLFSFSSCKDIINSLSYDPCRIHCSNFHIPALKMFKKYLGMLFFIISGLKEYRRDELIPFIPCCACKK